MARSLLRLALMNVSLFQAASALNANSRWQEIISDNLASASLPGFKKQQLTMSAVQAGLMPMGSSPQSFVLPKAGSATNFAAGEMKSTGVSTDVAIEGRGFFQVDLPGGVTGYTRDGELQVNSLGQLVTKEGYPVQGQGGVPIQLNPQDASPISIAPTGEISQGASAKGKLALTEFDKPELLTQLNASYFAAQNPKLNATQAVTSKVRQGYLEGSNSSTVMEMSNLMTAMRGFEANQHVIQITDDRLGKTIEGLGSTS
jgi:flagellar basal-body rod protein FlgF